MALCWDNVASRKILFDQFWSFEVFGDFSFCIIFGHILKFLKIAFPAKIPAMSPWDSR